MKVFVGGARAACALFLFVVVAGVEAQLPPWRPQPPSEPLKSASLRLDPAFAVAPPAGRWNLSFDVAEFNVWTHSWHTFATHRDGNRTGLEVADEELRLIEQNFAADTAWHIDVEGWRADLVLARGFRAGGASAGIRVPYMEIGSPQWDGVAETFHDLFGLETVERDLFPRGDTLVYLKSRDNDRVIERRQDLARSGVGDIALFASIPINRLPGEQRLAASVELPTGEEGTLHGSGGVDINVSWFAAWRSDKRNLSAAAGYTWLDPGGTFLGAQRSEHLGHALLGIDQRVWRNVWLTAVGRYDTSPLGDVIDSYAGDGATFYRVGVAVTTQRYGWFAFELGEELEPVTGLEADWVFQLTWGLMP